MRRDGKAKKRRFGRKEREVKARLRIDMARAATIKVKAFPRSDVPARPRPPRSKLGSPCRSEKEASKLSILQEAPRWPRYLAHLALRYSSRQTIKTSVSRNKGSLVAESIEVSSTCCAASEDESESRKTRCTGKIPNDFSSRLTGRCTRK